MHTLKQHTKSLFCSVGFLLTALLAGCGGSGGDQGRDPILGLPAADLVTVAVTPATSSVAIGATQQYKATATFADGASRDVTAMATWTSSSATVATIVATTGLASAKAAGSTTMTASYGSKTGNATLNVTPAVLSLTSISVTPANPSIAISGTAAMKAMGTYSDGTTKDITSTVTFTSGTPAVASIVAGGLATGLSSGSSVITATSGTVSGNTTLTVTSVTLVSIAITPANPTIQAGATRQMTVTATFSDNTTSNITSASTYTSATTSAVTINGTTGLALGVANGASVITATFAGKVASTTVTVTPASLMSISVTPASNTILLGATQGFVATGQYADNTTANITNTVSWTSSNTAVATILPTGVATGLTGGSSTMTASQGGVTGSATLTVSPTITVVSLTITPQNSTVNAGASTNFAAMLTYSDGSSVNMTNGVTWSSNNTGVATILSNGVATGVSAGTATLTAIYPNGATNIITTATLNVVAVPGTLTSIVVTPANSTTAAGATQQFTATGTFSDGTTRNVTSTGTWSSSAPTVATIASTTGLSTAVAAGVTTISVTQGGVSANTTLTVVPPTVLVVTPGPTASLNLRSAANFGVLAGTSITNNSGGTTLVTGDVGSPSQTVDPVQAAGFNNYKSGAILTTGLADLSTAVTDANSRTCTVSSAAGIDLGGQTLTPGVYCYSGAINITGTLTLNGPGLYIFRTTSTLNSTANSIVALIGGATASELFWVPVGPTTLGANSVFKGTVMAGASAITMGDNATLLTGRVLSGAAVTLRNNQITR